MKKSVLFKINSLYRDNFRVTGYTFGSGEKALCVVGNMRGNEIQQIYTCSQLIQRLKKLEEEGRIREGREILVIPSCNPHSMNIGKRFWPTDNTDINRMFPGYDLGETTQRIAAGIFDVIKEYKNGIQLTSFYMPGVFLPHLRMMTTGFENTELAKKFGLPYVVLRNTRPYDTTTLNYNWQIWETNAFSLYTTSTDKIDRQSAKLGVQSILNFMAAEEMIDYKGPAGYQSEILDDRELVSARVRHSGIFECLVQVGQEVSKGERLARVLDPCDGEQKEEIDSPVDGIIFFAHDEPLTYENTAVFKIIKREPNH
ncbi:MAG: M14 family metallopeptidase [Hominisplanchenecus sp.]|nr:M14 family metallopeptidase [Lachnospiraceae bacterium]MDY2820563.1 M14 family metallopeptidase [Hominisplanchenecus sp.]